MDGSVNTYSSRRIEEKSDGKRSASKQQGKEEAETVEEARQPLGADGLNQEQASVTREVSG
jgi:hypothetical protein